MIVYVIFWAIAFTLGILLFLLLILNIRMKLEEWYDRRK
tara:strand:- start:149 stop:265 length:117 start_codon:yes stop_codon:yes gene_type:complete